MKKRFKDLMVEYGALGLVVYLTSTCVVYLAFLFALQLGFKPSGAVAGGGIWIAAYVATKVTQPFRIAGAIAVTPLLAKLYTKLTGRSFARRAAG